MSLPAISVRDLGKMYRLSHQGKQTDSFREAITSALTSPLRRLRQLRGTDETMEEFWALKDVSFDVQPGEVVGIIGRNGAGKSTLLKILSRIVEPTDGEIVLRGRVASLLEVGTGFHPELSGRENIYLNGSILGMKRREIDRKFDEIVDFAEVQKFLDTPVKRYSSGMYVRLAFAVAAHLEPEILIVDEVLAVGDAAFQKKCLGKIKEVSQRGGRTVLFVSHNMTTILALCSEAIMMANGGVKVFGNVRDVASEYLRTQATEQKITRERPFQIYDVRIPGSNSKSSFMEWGGGLTFQVEISCENKLDDAFVGLNIYSSTRDRVATLWSGFLQAGLTLTKGRSLLQCTIQNVHLSPGEYSVSATLGTSREGLDEVDYAAHFTVFGELKGATRTPATEHGFWQPNFSWNIVPK